SGRVGAGAERGAGAGRASDAEAGGNAGGSGSGTSRARRARVVPDGPRSGSRPVTFAPPPARFERLLIRAFRNDPALPAILGDVHEDYVREQIGRASCRERAGVSQATQVP